MNMTFWMNKHWMQGAAVAGMLLLAGGAVVAETVDETRDSQPDATIEFSAVSGEFKVIGGDVDQISITGQLGDEVEELRIEGDSAHWRIEVEVKQHSGGNWPWGRGNSTSLEITVPERSTLRAAVVSADLEVRGMRGAMLDARTVSGDLDVRGSSPSRLDAESVSGDVTIDGAGLESSNIKSVSGDVEASGLAGRIRGGSVSGDFNVDAVEVSEFNAETVSGDMALNLRPTSRASIEVQSHSGDIDLTLPAGTAVNLDAETFSGDLKNFFDGDTEDVREKGLTVRAGDGGVRARARTFSGSFKLHQAEG